MQWTGAAHGVLRDKTQALRRWQFEQFVRIIRVEDMEAVGQKRGKEETCGQKRLESTPTFKRLSRIASLASAMVKAALTSEHCSSEAAAAA
jgi:hypothetical protein